MTLIEQTVGGVRWRLAPTWLEGLGTGALDRLFGAGGPRLAEWQSAGHALLVKQGPVRSVYHVRLPDGEFHLKHDHPDRRALFAPAKARGEFERLLAVAGRGVHTLEPLACGEAGRRGCYLLTRTLAGAESLAAFLQSTLPTLPEKCQPRLRQRLAEGLGE